MMEDKVEVTGDRNPKDVILVNSVHENKLVGENSKVENNDNFDKKAMFQQLMMFITNMKDELKGDINNARGALNNVGDAINNVRGNINKMGQDLNKVGDRFEEINTELCEGNRVRLMGLENKVDEKIEVVETNLTINNSELLDENIDEKVRHFEFEIKENCELEINENCEFEINEFCELEINGNCELEIDENSELEINEKSKQNVGNNIEANKIELKESCLAETTLIQQMSELSEKIIECTGEENKSKNLLVDLQSKHKYDIELLSQRENNVRFYIEIIRETLINKGIIHKIKFKDFTQNDDYKCMPKSITQMKSYITGEIKNKFIRLFTFNRIFMGIDQFYLNPNMTQTLILLKNKFCKIENRIFKFCKIENRIFDKALKVSLNIKLM